MPTTLCRRPAAVLAGVLLAPALALVAAYVVLRGVPALLLWPHPDVTLLSLVDLSGEQNVWSWYNVLLLAAAGVASGLVGLLAHRSGAAWRPWLAAAGVLLALSLDDATSLHERLHPVGERLGGGDGFTEAAWLVPGLAVATVVVALLARLLRRLEGLPRTLLGFGLVAFLGAAFGLESVSNAVGERYGSGVAYQLLMITEELLEAVGAVALLLCPLTAVAWERGEGAVVLRYTGGRRRPSAEPVVPAARSPRAARLHVLSGPRR